MRFLSFTIVGLILIAGAFSICSAQIPTPPKTAVSESLSKEQLAQINSIDESLKQTAKEISQRNPDLTPQVVNDAKVILDSRKSVTSIWNNVGYGYYSQKSAESYIWRELRLRTLKPNEPLKP